MFEMQRAEKRRRTRLGRVQQDEQRRYREPREVTLNKIFQKVVSCDRHKCNTQRVTNAHAQEGTDTRTPAEIVFIYAKSGSGSESGCGFASGFGTGSESETESETQSESEAASVWLVCPEPIMLRRR